MAQHESAGKSDEWYTPKYIFDALGCEFDLDAAAPEDTSGLHVPAKHFISSGSLEKEWFGFVWLNPPFGARNSKSAWLDKMYTCGNGIVLVPDRSSAPWWQKAAKKCDSLLMVSKKIKFQRPDGSYGKSPSTGTTFFAYGPKGVEALFRAEKKGLGIALNRQGYVNADMLNSWNAAIEHVSDDPKYDKALPHFNEWIKNYQ